MKKVITNNLWKSKEQKDNLKMKGVNLGTLISLNPHWINPHWINPLNLCLGLVFALLLSSFGSRTGLVAFVSLSFYLAYNFFTLRLLCEKLSIKREVPLNVVENEQLTIKYILVNRSHTSIEDSFLTDSFEGTQMKEIISEISVLKAGQRKIMYSKVNLDNGMGKKRFYHLTLHISDVLGIFVFKIYFVTDLEIEIFPRIENKDHEWSRPNEETFKYGCFEIPKRGDSINFKGIREYHHGEPIKYINWLLSSKSGKILMNEFEKFVDSHVIVSFNSDIKTHIGEGAISTLEYAKDLSLLIAGDQLKKGNELTLLTSQKMYPMGTGIAQIRFLELILCSMEAQSSTQSSSLRFLNSDSSRGATIIHIMPLHKEDYFINVLDCLKKLSHEDRNVILITLDAAKYVNQQIEGDAKTITTGLINFNEGQIKKIKKYIAGSNIFFQNIDINKNPSFESERDKFLFEHEKFRRIYG
jgi:uncharacterized protein (DUF58 family)